MLRLALIENLRRGRRAHRARPRRPQPRRQLGRPDDRHGRDRPQEPDPGDRRHGALQSADQQLVRGRAGAPPAGQESGPGVAVDLDRAAPVGIRPDHRAAGAGREPAPGRRPGLDRQQHRQPALPRRHGLARVRRVDERCRGHPARGSRRRLRGDGLRQPRPLSPRAGAHGQAQRAQRGATGAPGGRAGARGAARRRRASRARGLLPGRRGTGATRARRRGARAARGRVAPRDRARAADGLPRARWPR